MITLRPACLADVPAIAALHVKVWRHAYRDLAPASAHAALDEARRRQQWQAMLSSCPASEYGLVALRDGAIAGIGYCGEADKPALAGYGEVRLLYVDQDHAGQGIGRALMKAMADLLAAAGHRRLALGVVDGNLPAIAFYQALGGRIAGRFTNPGPLWPSDDLIMAWDDIAVLQGDARA
jgi:GNAT superfamily N-acetyltransferase